jgi:hypothetical protein
MNAVNIDTTSIRTLGIGVSLSGSFTDRAINNPPPVAVVTRGGVNGYNRYEREHARQNQSKHSLFVHKEPP